MFRFRERPCLKGIRWKEAKKDIHIFLWPTYIHMCLLHTNNNQKTNSEKKNASGLISKHMYVVV